MLLDREFREVRILREEILFFRIEIELPLFGKMEFKLFNPDIPSYAVTHMNEEKSLIKQFKTYEQAEHWCSEMGYQVADRW